MSKLIVDTEASLPRLLRNPASLIQSAGSRPSPQAVHLNARLLGGDPLRWPTRLVVSTLFLLSGATALVYQVAWSRSLSLIFGASHQAVSIVLAAFMAGLALGGFVLGRRCERFAKPLRAYGLLELGVAASAVLVPVMLLGVQSFYVALAERIGTVGWQLNAFRVAIAFAVLVIPTFFMGGTLPVLVRAVVAGAGEFGARLAWLYAINTAGAVVGAALCGFVLLPHFGVRNTEMVAIAVNLAVGLTAFFVGDRWRSPAPERDGSPERPAAIAPPPTALPVLSAAQSLALRFAYAGTFVSGLCGLALEVLWTRAIGTAMGTTTYSFTIILCVFLLGILLGSAIIGLIPLRRVPEPVLFGVVLCAVGVTTLIVSYRIPSLPQLAVEINTRMYGGAAGIRPASTALLSAIVMLLPTTLMGIAFPLAGRAGVQLSRKFGRTVGELIGLNTVGGILGPLLSGFILVPAFGMQNSMVLVCALYLCYGLFVLAAWAAARLPRPRLVIAGAALAAVAILAATPRIIPRWDLHTLGAFQNNTSTGYTDADGHIDVRKRLTEAQVLYYREGRTATVSVVQTQQSRAFVINGRTEATDYQNDLQVEYLLGHVPVLLHPNPRSALVVCLGAGMTLGGVAAHPEPERITMVEIEPAVLGVARTFSDLNGGPLDDPRVHLVVQDGRNFLLTSPERYDVITSDPLHPWSHGASYLYTSEYYTVARRHLTSNGIMCQWMPLYELSLEDLRCIVASFCANFEYTMVWQTNFDAILVGSPQPIRIDYGQLQRRLQRPQVARQLARIGTEDAMSFLAEFALNDAEVRAFARGGVVNTDDNLHLEFTSPHSIGSNFAENVLDVDRRRVSPASIVTGWGAPFESRRDLELTFGQFMDAKHASVALSMPLDDALQSGSAAAWEAVIQELRRLVAALPEYQRPRVQLAEALTSLATLQLAARAPEQAVATLQSALEVNPRYAPAHFQLATALLSQRQVEAALPGFLSAIELQAHYPRAHWMLGNAMLALGRPEEAVSYLRTAAALEPLSPEVHAQLSAVEARLATLPPAASSSTR